MKHDQDWFIDKLDKSEEFAIAVRVSAETISYVPVEKSTAAQLVEQGAEYGYFVAPMLIIGATSQESDEADAKMGKDTPEIKSTSPVHCVKRIPIPYNQLEAIMQDLLDRGYVFLTSHQEGAEMITFWDIVK